MSEEEQIVKKVRLTPAERAVLAEQGEGLVVQMQDFVTKCREGTAQQVVFAWMDTSSPIEYVTHMMSHKINDAALAVGAMNGRKP